jgi:hypothetical protein
MNSYLSPQTIPPTSSKEVAVHFDDVDGIV